MKTRPKRNRHSSHYRPSRRHRYLLAKAGLGLSFRIGGTVDFQSTSPWLSSHQYASPPTRFLAPTPKRSKAASFGGRLFIYRPRKAYSPRGPKTVRHLRHGGLGGGRC